MKNIASKCQKYSGFIGVIVFAILFVYSLGMATPTASLRTYSQTREFYSEIMPYNNAILILSVIGLLIASFYFVLRNNIRKVYYISNFVWSGINFVYTILCAIVTFIGVSFYQGKYQALDFETINNYYTSNSYPYYVNANTSVFILGYICGVLVLLSLVPYIIVLVDKVRGRILYERNKAAGIENPVSYDPKEVK